MENKTGFFGVIELFDYRRLRAACANQSQGARRPIGRVGGPRAPSALAFATSHKTPDGADVFPRAEDVGRALAPKLLSMDSVRFV